MDLRTAALTKLQGQYEKSCRHDLSHATLDDRFAFAICYLDRRYNYYI